MIVYIKTQSGVSLIEKGEILTIGGFDNCHILTGNNKNELELIGKYPNNEIAIKMFNELILRIINPSDSEIKRGAMYIDLKVLEEVVGGIE
jgi:hypothetical protein